MLNFKGFKRPLLKRQGKYTPVPWVGGDNPAHGEWRGIDSSRARNAYYDKLCIVCGLSYDNDYVLGHVSGQVRPYDPSGFGLLFSVAAPAPLEMHAKCLLIAATFCPHLNRQEFPGETKYGEPLTQADLRKLAHGTKVPG